ncbi:fic family toxin-antitoxin system, toxin component [Streptomyces agglomeratus]|uniref:Fic family toxin-antitoxin system, toxin component n=1 Tax=Streptomyces agglomeratus TaxID=285458 RepID=A0A1E5PEV8_9ACTN|nr:fic family toxin-antitoxin system, toxin component [Streptomyces agglomeratus]OEJ28063.1 fic family toxin-antitoxin system, toxin component [Streptomyces agglomeratus]OEJ37874.1 fic family toxin-antitoxin system, toxin component [Streptomyces agglomeratus]OEJ47741.1 fic family toxin-antitoxin system, toxin component [Streptomyces agglomeratus]OEJ50409.1 fic family toxin-antitoxin system, toxin component [Streptomyces agglomeratus]OEJ57738.1 fic family toxin-antitoxin system, toxin component
MTLRIDLAWLLMIAEHKTPGDPQVVDWGALVAAVARHEAEIFGIPVYRDPAARAAALLQLLLHVPALERSNAMFASAVAYGYLVACGLKVVTSPEQVRDLARLIKESKADVHVIAEELRQWSR